MKMNAKTFGLFGLSILFAIMFIGLSSAVELTAINSISIPTSVSHNANSFQITFNLTNSGVAGAIYDLSDFTSTQTGLTSAFNLYTIADGSTGNFVATITFNPHQTGNITGNIGVGNDGVTVDQSFAFSVPITESKSLSVSSATLDSNGNATITVKNTGNVALNNITLTDSGLFDVVFNTTGFNLIAGATQNVLVSVNGNVDDLVGLNDVTITATANDTTTKATGKVTLNQGDYCEVSTSGNIDVSIEDITILNGFGDDWDFWYPLDNVEVEVEISNDANGDLNDVVVEWGVYNKATGKWIIQEEEDDFNLKEDDKETLLLKFKLNEDIEEYADGDFVFYVRATAEDEENNDKEICASASKESVEITIEKDFVMIDKESFEVNDLKLTDLKLVDPVSCGSELRITADIWNIGEGDQSDVYIMIHNKELGINQKYLVGDIDAFDKEDLEVTIKLPENVDAKEYYLSFTIYDEDDDVYENEEDGKADFYIAFKTEGSCAVAGKAKVTATLESGGKVGKELIIKASVSNTGDAEAEYLVSPSSYAEWADSIKVDESVFTLAPGESRELTLTIQVKEDATIGEKLFQLEVLSGDELATRQPISVSIEKSSKWDSVAGITGNVISGDNWHLWGIGILNVALVALIVFVARRVAKEN